MHDGAPFSVAGRRRVPANLVSQRYRINEFKVTDGNCYEIYGFDPDQTSVEIYLIPSTAAW